MDSPVGARPGIQRALQELESDIAGWEAEVEQLRAKITKARKAREILRSYEEPDQGGDQQDVEFAPRQRSRRHSEAWKIRQGAYRALVSAGKPLSASEILAKLRDEGLVVDGPKPASKVYRTLWDAKDAFARTESGFTLVLADDPNVRHVAALSKSKTPTA